MLTPFLRWLKAGSGRDRAGRGHCRKTRPRAPVARRRSFVPGLEAQEDRTVPSTFTVLNLLDSGADSLRQAVLEANANPGPDVIAFHPGLSGTIVLTSGQLSITDDLQIDGPGANRLTVQRSTALDTPEFRIFFVSSGAMVSLSGLTISGGGGLFLTTREGGGIYNAGNLTVSNSTFSDNRANSGGGIYNAGTLTVISSTLSRNVALLGGGIANGSTLTLNDSTVSGNGGGNGGNIFNSGAITLNNTTISGSFQCGILNVGTATLNNSTVSGNHNRGGGGIYNVGTATLNNSTVSGNSADPGAGGGICNEYTGTLTLNNSTVSGNSASFSAGGGICNSGTATLNNSTVSGNSVSGRADNALGGGIYNDGTLNIGNSTITGNRASGFYTASGGGIWTYARASLNLRNSIVAGNAVSGSDEAIDPDIRGPLTSSGYNLIGDTSGGTGFDATDLLGVNPLLGPLQDNGGPTFTHALLPGSPALDAGDNTGAPQTDQRGLPRIVNGTIDIGAFEVQTPPVTVRGVVVNDGSAQRSSVYALNVTFTSTVTLDDGAFEVAREDGSLLGLLVTTEVVDGRTVATITFTGEGLNGNSLADGNYTLTIRGDRVHDLLGQDLDGDGDGFVGGDRTEAFFRLYGDSDGDRDVDLQDVVSFFGTFGRAAEDPEFLGFFDFDGDGAVDTTDLLEFAGRYGTQLNP